MFAPSVTRQARAARHLPRRAELAGEERYAAAPPLCLFTGEVDRAFLRETEGAKSNQLIRFRLNPVNARARGDRREGLVWAKRAR